MMALPTLPPKIKADIYLVRADLNLPMQGGVITDDTRLQRFLPGLNKYFSHGAKKIIILSHLGRPKEKNNKDSLKPIADRMEQLLGDTIGWLPDTIGPAMKEIIQNTDHRIYLAENLRFFQGEENNDEDFAQSLADLGDIYINDAFSVSHRAHASVVAITKFLPSYAGESLLAEVKALQLILDQPKKPVAAIIGGAKISTKIALLEFIMPKLQHLIIGGAMANSFLSAKNIFIGKSLVEPDYVAVARKILSSAEQHGCQIHLPLDVVVAEKLEKNIAHDTINLAEQKIGADTMILDVGPATIASLKQTLSSVATLLWNGPLGAFETPPFDKATHAIAQYVARLSQEKKLVSVAGGGDTASALSDVAEDFGYISTAGGAFLEWLEGKTLPAIKALMDATP